MGTTNKSYTARVQGCIEILMDAGTDRYGGTQTPVLASILDVESRTCPEYPQALDEEWRVVRRGRRNPAGANLLSDNSLLRTMVLLSRITGIHRYGDFARNYAEYYMTHFVDEKGFFWWGWHRHVDLYMDRMDGHDGNPHEIHAINCIDWDWLWAVNEEAVVREIEAIWQWHVINKKTGEINRHGDGQPGCDFSMSAGAFIEAFAFLFARTADTKWLDRALLLEDYFWARRDQGTGLFPDRPNAGIDRFDGRSFLTSITGLYCHSLLKAFRLTNETVFRDHAITILRAYAELGYDNETGKFWGALRLDGTPYLGPRILEGYAMYEPRGHLDLWSPYSAGYQHSIYTAQIYAYAYELTGDSVLLSAAERFADWMKRTPPGSIETPSTWYSAYSEGPGREGTHAGKYGRSISFLLHLCLATGEQGYLAHGRALADTAVEKLSHDGLFRGHPAKPYYEAMDGVGYLLYALLQLDQILERPEVGLYEHVFPIDIDGQTILMDMDNW